MKYYNPETGRMVMPVVFGWAVYSCLPPEEGQVTANREGMVRDEKDANRWLAGVPASEIKSMINGSARTTVRGSQK